MIDLVQFNESDKLRLLESLELTSKFSDGVIYLYDMDKEVIDDIFSTKYACPHCGYSLTVLEPKFFHSIALQEHVVLVMGLVSWSFLIQKK